MNRARKFMYWHINLSKLYLMLDDLEIYFKVLRLNMRSLILYVFKYLEVFFAYLAYL